MENHLNCPNCGHGINVNEIVYNQIKQELKIEYNEKNALEKKELEKKLRIEIAGETSAEIEAYKEQLSIKVNEVKEFNRLKAQLEITKREKEELKEKIEAESELRLTQALNSEKEKIKREMESKNELKVLEKETIINSLKQKLEEAQRRIEQGSMELQGETQEILIEDYLRRSFPFDTVEEVKKGARGADCALIVNASKTGAGVIYIESKRTKDFQPAWIEKFKSDMRSKGAMFGILVTDAMPKDMERMGQREGIWICSLDEFKSLVFVLRESVVLLSEVAVSQENKGHKMNMLYDYLTSQECSMQLQAVVESLNHMTTDLASEKRALEIIWKKREKQIYKACLNMGDFYGSIKGIAGSVLGNIPSLELPEPDSKEKK
jgi:hypothetical protein